jgi:hypothetical protein
MLNSNLKSEIVSELTAFRNKKTKQKEQLSLFFLLPGGVLLSQGETPNYHRR